MSSLHRSPTAAPLEDDDLLSEVLLCLPPQPSSLPRASAVCRRWRSLATDPRFSRRFRAHHRRNPPLLGCFVRKSGAIFFEPSLEAPNRVPQCRFSIPVGNGHRFLPLGCRHGLMLLFHVPTKQLLVWDPVSGDQHRTDIPPGFDRQYSISAAVLRTVGDVQHFRVVLVGGTSDRQHIQASVYSSETSVWGNRITAVLPSELPTSGLRTLVFSSKPAVMAGNSLYWKLVGNSVGIWKLVGNLVGILEFDLENECLAVIQVQKEGAGLPLLDDQYAWNILTEAGGLCFLFHSGLGFYELWKRNKGCDGVASWLLKRTIELDKLLPLNSDKERELPAILGFAEENNLVLLSTSIGAFSVQLQSLQVKKLFKSNRFYFHCPFEAVYTADTSIVGGQGGAQLLHNTSDGLSG